MAKHFNVDEADKKLFQAFLRHQHVMNPQAQHTTTEHKARPQTQETKPQVQAAEKGLTADFSRTPIFFLSTTSSLKMMRSSSCTVVRAHKRRTSHPDAHAQRHTRAPVWTWTRQWT